MYFFPSENQIKTYHLEDLLRKQPAKLFFMKKILDVFYSIKTADFSDEVDPVPVILTVLAQILH